jgi:8-oxo-dGTP diphosphatase
MANASSTPSSSLPQQQPQVGIGVFVLQSPSQQQEPPTTTTTTTTTGGTKFLMGKRLGSLGAHTWALPGGHLEFGESFEQCALRETLEETGLRVEGLRFLTAVNSVMTDRVGEGSEGSGGRRHYVTVFMVGVNGGSVLGEEGVGGGKWEAVVREREKCERWEWVEWEDLVRWVGGDGLGEGRGGGRRMFQPMVDLLGQRDGIGELLRVGIGRE